LTGLPGVAAGGCRGLPMVEVVDAAHREDFGVPDATFAVPDVTRFARLDGLGLKVTGQFLEPDRAVLACRVIDPDHLCRRCGSVGVPRGTVTRQLEYEPLGWRPTLLLVTVRRYRCTGCGHVWRQDTTRAAQPRARLSRGGLRWALEGLVCRHLTVARIAEAFGVSWNTANDAVLAEGRRVLIEDPHRLDGVQVIGVDEHVWRHTRRGDKYVTVIIDLTRSGTRQARPACWTWSKAARRRRSPRGSSSRNRPGATVCRWSRWMGSPASRPPPPNSCPTPPR